MSKTRARVAVRALLFYAEQQHDRYEDRDLKVKARDAALRESLVARDEARRLIQRHGLA